MNSLQSKLLTILSKFAIVCQKNNLKYTMCGGTLLGAIRHKGFIPWDDDIDISMPRPDYEKLISNFSMYFEEYPELELGEKKLNKSFPLFFAKIYDSQTTLIEKYKNNFKSGVYIDIFPIDGISIDTVKKDMKQSKLLLNINNVKLGYYDPDRFRNKLPLIISKFIASFFSIKSINSRMNKLITKYDFSQSPKVMCYFGMYGTKEIFDQNVYFDTIDMQFESITVKGSKHFDVYLKQIYGKYMELPSIENQIPKHSYKYLNLDQSYKEFRGM